MFVCGPTVYGPSHLGHAKTFVQFDFIARYLRLSGYEVRYVQNITDIDDKIIKKSKEDGVSWHKISRSFEESFLEDMRALHVCSVDQYPRATDFIPQIVKQIKGLLDKGSAYRISDGIYFDLSTFPEYGKLSGRREQKEDDSVSRIDDSPEKKNWNDFCLWKFKKEGEPFWEVEIGTGRPGWHIEDTAITEHLFGPQYDLHGGVERHVLQIDGHRAADIRSLGDHVVAPRSGKKDVERLEYAGIGELKVRDPGLVIGSLNGRDHLNLGRC